MKRTKDIKAELEAQEKLDYLEQYYKELVDSSVSEEVKKGILNQVFYYEQ